MSQYNHTDELYHWGVKGMRWGVRKDKKSTSRRTPREKAPRNKNADKTTNGKNATKTALKVAGGLAVAGVAGTAIYSAGKFYSSVFFASNVLDAIGDAAGWK